MTDVGAGGGEGEILTDIFFSFVPQELVAPTGARTPVGAVSETEPPS